MTGPNGIDVANLFTSPNSETMDVPGYDAIEAELKAFEAEERKRLGIDEEKVEQWRDLNPQGFTKKERTSTTILLGGLTRAQDYLIAGALQGVGYKVKSMDVPDYE